MPIISVNLNSENSSKSENAILFNLDVLLYPTIVFFRNEQKVHINKYARELLALKENQEFNIDKWNKINPHINRILYNVEKENICDQRVLLTLFNGKKEIISFNLSIIKYNSNSTAFLFQFMKAANKYSISSLSSLHSIGDEIRKLMPYLNKPGKELLKDIIASNFHEENKQLLSDDLIYYEREIQIISETFPELSHQEVIICGLLINEMDNNEISLLTKKSLNSLFVTIHRINRKLNLKDRKELVDTLKRSIENKTKEQNNLKLIDDFDI